MKLYTEEQLHNTVIAISNYLDDINLGRAQENIKKYLKELKPIELPTDKAMEREQMMELISFVRVHNKMGKSVEDLMQQFEAYKGGEG